MGGTAPGTLFEGLVSGVAHPFIGPDHFFFLVVVGMLLAFQRLRHRLLAVCALSGGLLTGVLAAVAGLVLPLADIACVLTLIGIGVAAVSTRDMGPGPLAATAGLAALFHGVAFANAILGAESTPLVAYLSGLSLTAGVLVLGVGVLVSTLATGFDRSFPRQSRRWAGIAALTIGHLMLLQSLAGI